MPPPVEIFFGPSGLEDGFAAIGMHALAIFLAQIFRRAIGIRTCFCRAWNVRRPSAWWRPLSSHATGPLASCNLGCCASRAFILLRLSCRAVAVVSNMCGCKAELGRGNICRQMLLTKPTFPFCQQHMPTRLSQQSVLKVFSAASPCQHASKKVQKPLDLPPDLALAWPCPCRQLLLTNLSTTFADAPVADNAQIWRQKVLAGTLWPPPSFQFRGTVLGLPKRVGVGGANSWSSGPQVKLFPAIKANPCWSLLTRSSTGWGNLCRQMLLTKLSAEVVDTHYQHC